MKFRTHGRPATCGAKWPFLAAFAFSCVLFWWVPSIIFRMLLNVDDPVQQWALIVSAVGLLTFAIGYLLPPLHFRPSLPSALLDSCEKFAYKGTIIIAIPAVLVSLQYAYSRLGVPYGSGDPIPSAYQAGLYGHMLVGFMFLGLASLEKGNGRKIAVAIVLIVLPRLLVSLQGGRFFLAQALVPMILIALSRGWLRMSPKRAFQVVGLALVIVFVPALTRGDKVLGQDEIVAFFVTGSTLRVFQDNKDLNLSDQCPPLLVSMTAKLIPYGLLNVCTVDIWGEKGLPATLDRILADNDPTTEGTLNGPGSNYLLELYLTPSLFAGIWAQCLTRALLAPRGNLGYVYEQVPVLVLASLAVAAFVYFWKFQLRTASA